MFCELDLYLEHIESILNEISNKTTTETKIYHFILILIAKMSKILEFFMRRITIRDNFSERINLFVLAKYVKD